MAAAAARLFYQSWTAAVILSPLAVPYCMYRVRGEREKKKRILSGQFREMLECVNNALRAGDSPENAFREGYTEMVYEYGEYAPITRAMSTAIYQGRPDRSCSSFRLIPCFTLPASKL